MASFTIASRPIARPIPSDPSLRADIEHVLEHGYVILKNQFSKAEAEEAKAEINRLSGKKPLVGRNNFEGLNTNRIYSILNKTRVFDKFALLPRVLALNDYFLDPGYNITAYHTIVIQPGESTQDLHHGIVPSAKVLEEEHQTDKSHSPQMTASSRSPDHALISAPP